MNVLFMKKRTFVIKVIETGTSVHFDPGSVKQAIMDAIGPDSRFKYGIESIVEIL